MNLLKLLKHSLQAKSLDDLKQAHIIKIYNEYINQNQSHQWFLKKEIDYLFYMMTNN